MKVNKGETIIATLQLVKSDGISVEEDATVAYKVLDSSFNTVVSVQNTEYNTTTKSYIDALVPSLTWTTQEVGSYMIVWGVSGTDDDFLDTYTESLNIDIDEDDITDIRMDVLGVSAAVMDNQEVSNRILGLTHENIYIDNTRFDTDDNLYSARLRTYSTSASVGTANDVLATYQITATTTGPGTFSNWKQVRV